MKFKKLLGVLLVLILSTATIMGCKKADDDTNKKIDSFKDSIKAGTAIKQYTSEAKIQASLIGDFEALGVDSEVLDLLGITDRFDMSVYVNTQYASSKNNKVAIGYNFAKYNSDVLGIVTVDGTSYFDLKMLKNAFLDVAGLFGDANSIQAAMNKVIPDGDYIIITQDLIDMIIDTLGIDATAAISKESTQSISDFIEFVGREVDKAANKSDDVFTKDGNCYKFTINSKNIGSFVKALADVVANDSDRIVRVLNAAFGDVGITSAELKQMAMLIKSQDISNLLGDNADIYLTISTEVSDNTWKLGASFGATYEGVSLEYSIDYKRVEDKNIKIEEPSNIVPEDEINKIDPEKISSIMSEQGTTEDETTTGKKNSGEDETTTGKKGSIEDETTTGKKNSGEDETITTKVREEDEEGKVYVENSGKHGISNKLTDMQVYFDGKIYSIGKSTASEFLSKGYTLDTYYSTYRADTKEKPFGNGSSYLLYVKEYDGVCLEIANISNKEKALKDSEIIYFEFDSYWEEDVEFYLVGDITIGTKANTAISILGNPTKSEETYDGYELIWTMDNGDYYAEYVLTFDSLTDKLISASLSNYKLSY